MEQRISKINYYLDIAQTVASRSTCLRKKYGAIIVKNDIIISTGYCGSPRGRKNCSDMSECIRDKLNVPRGERYELCRSVHSEANAIIAASREQMIDSVMYLSCIDSKTDQVMGDIDSCQMCKKLIINAGISRVLFRNTPTEYRSVMVSDWIAEDDSLGKIGY